MQQYHYDVVISGAGPAGTSCAIRLSKSGLKVAILDKASFPRDKTCGDALSVDVINQLAMLSEELPGRFEKMENKIASYGVRIFSPNHKHVDIPFIYKGQKSCGYISPRLHFDDVLFQFVKEKKCADIFEMCEVKSVSRQNDQIELQTSKGTFTCSMVIGADGAHSAVSRHLGSITVEKEHFSAGLRLYYENVPSFTEGNFIELHFFREILPGYLWVFPLANNRANVGIGMLSSTVAKQKLNVKEVFKKILDTHPEMKERFKDARPLETVKGYGLPLGSKKRHLSGDRFLLTGDAASLIDPFSGEGIANAIRSGRVAADHLIRCFEAKNFSVAFNKAYDKEIYRRMWTEFRISRTLQRLVRYPVLFNFVVGRAKQSKYLQQFLIEALANVEKKRKILYKPAFYYRMLFNK